MFCSLAGEPSSRFPGTAAMRNRVCSMARRQVGQRMRHFSVPVHEVKTSFINLCHVPRLQRRRASPLNSEAGFRPPRPSFCSSRRSLFASPCPRYLVTTTFFMDLNPGESR